MVFRKRRAAPVILRQRRRFKRFLLWSVNDANRSSFCFDGFYTKVLLVVFLSHYFQMKTSMLLYKHHVSIRFFNQRSLY